MQVHEITLSPIKEGFLDAAKLAAGGFVSGLVGAETGIGSPDPARQAQQAAAALSKKGYGAGYKGGTTDWQEKHATVTANPAVTDYIKNVASAWKAVEPKSTTNEADGDNIQGVKAGAPTPAEREALQKRIAQVTGAAKSAQDTEKSQYLKQFETWADSQLATKTSTGDVVKMEVVRQLPGLQQRLSSFLGPLWSTRGTPQQEQVIQEYLKVAVAGVQAVAQAMRNKRLQAGELTKKPLNSTGDPDIDKALEKAGYRIVK